jgi:hypothetical protein
LAKGEKLEDVCQYLSQKSSVAVCVIGPVAATLPREIDFEGKDQTLGSTIDKVIGAFPGARAVGGRSNGVIVSVPVKEAVEKAFEATVENVHFKGTFRELLEKCPGVRDCHLSYTAMRRYDNVIELSYHKAVSAQEILLDAALALGVRYDICVADDASTIKWGDKEYSVILRSITLAAFKNNAATTRPAETP